MRSGADLPSANPAQSDPDGDVPRRGGAASWRVPIIAAVVALAAWLASRLLAMHPDIAESWASGPGVAISRPLSLLTGVAPFAVSEVLAAVYVATLIARFVRSLQRVVRRQRRWLDALAGGARIVIRDAGIAITLFYLLWGLNYGRPALETRLGWPEWSGIEPPELARLAEQAVLRANEAYLDLHHVPDAGHPTAFEGGWPAVEHGIDGGWARVAEALGLDPVIGARYGRIKQPLVSGIIARFGIVGMYVPFTAEATAVRGLPPVRFAASAAHEKAHQRGTANESEASFLGYLAGALSREPHARYAAAIFAENQLVSALAGSDRDEFQRIAGLRVPGITRDLRDVRSWFSRYDGVGVSVGRAVNDRYLRANRVPGGVRSYGRSVRLLITYARLHDGDPWPGDDGTATR